MMQEVELKADEEGKLQAAAGGGRRGWKKKMLRWGSDQGALREEGVVRHPLTAALKHPAPA